MKRVPQRSGLAERELRRDLADEVAGRLLPSSRAAASAASTAGRDGSDECRGGDHGGVSPCGWVDVCFQCHGNRPTCVLTTSRCPGRSRASGRGPIATGSPTRGTSSAATSGRDASRSRAPWTVEIPSAVAYASASAALSATTVTESGPAAAGSPVAGSMRWWSRPPGPNRRVSRPDVATPPLVELQRPSDALRALAGLRCPRATARLRAGRPRRRCHRRDRRALRAMRATRCASPEARALPRSPCRSLRGRRRRPARRAPVPSPDRRRCTRRHASRRAARPLSP